MFALIDCNNFYASCERLFRPDLHNRPIIVLSSNDGCVIARSNEAKALGIAMGEPYFKIKTLCRTHQVQVFSSNFALYGDLSHRVMQSIENSWPDVEIYSIDEAFLDLSQMPNEQHESFCQNLQRKILKDTGIPTSIGIGQTKTLAKVANHMAKKILKIPVFNITPVPHWLDKIPIEDVWGIGRRWAAKLLSINIYTAGDLSRADVHLLRKRFSVVLQRTAYELRGIPCLKLEETAIEHSIISSKSFGSLQTEFRNVSEAVSSHMARAWEKMRQQNLVAQYVAVFIHSSQFRKDLPQYANSSSFKLVIPSDDLRLLTHCAKRCLKAIFKENIHYKKAGVMLEGLIPKAPRQQDLFCSISDEETEASEKLMTLIETINHRFGSHTLHLAAEGHSKPWCTKREMKSPAYTTRWSDLPIVHLKS